MRDTSGYRLLDGGLELTTNHQMENGGIEGETEAGCCNSLSRGGTVGKSKHQHMVTVGLLLLDVFLVKISL